MIIFRLVTPLALVDEEPEAPHPDNAMPTATMATDATVAWRESDLRVINFSSSKAQLVRTK
jgi:hypothetical protein